MINEVTIKSGILYNLLKDKTIKFSPGINVIWGRNGVGKSLLLKTIGNYCFVDQISGGGWSQKSIWFKFSSYDYKYKTEDKNLSDVYEFDKKSKIDIEWSGAPCFYMHHDDMIDHTHIMGYEMCGSQWIKGIGKMGDIVKKHDYNPSSGQMIKGVAEMLLNIKTPDLCLKEEGYSYSGNDLSNYIEIRKEQFKGDNAEKPTLLLDEVDSQLDLFNQMWFHKEILPELAKKYQIIMVSHSIFAVHYYSEMIELDDSLELVKKELNIK